MEVLGAGLVRVRLVNGHQVVAHAARKDRERAVGLKSGDLVRLEMSPFDMSVGRILFKSTKTDET
jgi:translation initiation factor IF-1